MQMHFTYAVSSERSQTDKNQHEIPSRYHSKPAQLVYGVGLWDTCYPRGGRSLRKAMRGLLSVGYKGTFSLLKIIKYLLGLVYFFTLGSSLRSPAEGEGHEGFPPPPDKDLESPSSTRLEALVPSRDLRAMTCSPSPHAWRPDFPGAAREAP